MATGMSSFQIVWTSQASANQRAGRAGRTAPGHCYRLYSSAIFNDTFPLYSSPEICKIPIEGMVLLMMSMGIQNVTSFPFPTPPDATSLKAAFKTLTFLGALQPHPKFPEQHVITPLGKTLALFPVSPRFAKMLVLGHQGGCLGYVIAIVAALAVGNPLLSSLDVEDYTPNKKEQEVTETKIKVTGIENDEKIIEDENEDKNEDENETESTKTQEEEKQKQEKEDKERRKVLSRQIKKAHSVWFHPDSDHLSILRAIGSYDFAGATEEFCKRYFLHHKTMKEINELRQQLSSIINSILVFENTQNENSEINHIHDEEDSFTSQKFKKKLFDISEPLQPPSQKQEILLRQIITAGLIDQLAAIIVETPGSTPTTPDQWKQLNSKQRHLRTRLKLCMTGKDVFIHQNSSIWNRGGNKSNELDFSHVVYSEVVDTTRRVQRAYLKTVTIINSEWLFNLCGEPLYHISKPLDVPPPKYSNELDEVRCLCKATYGPLLFPLLPLEVPYPDCTQRYLFFARFLLEGKVFDTLSAFTGVLTVRPTLLTNNWAIPKISTFVRPFIKNLICSRKSLAAIWKHNPQFLQQEYKQLLPAEHHSLLLQVWPPSAHTLKECTKLIDTRLNLLKQQ